MNQVVKGEGKLTVNISDDSTVELVNRFCYLGDGLIHDSSADARIQNGCHQV